MWLFRGYTFDLGSSAEHPQQKRLKQAHSFCVLAPSLKAMKELIPVEMATINPNLLFLAPSQQYTPNPKASPSFLNRRSRLSIQEDLRIRNQQGRAGDGKRLSLMVEILGLGLRGLGFRVKVARL